MRGKPNANLTFNLVEITIALMIIMVGLVGVMSVLPKGMQTSQETVSRLCAADTADQFLNFFVTEIHKDWDMRKCIPTAESLVYESSDPVFSDNGFITNDNIDIEFQANNDVDEWDPNTFTTGVFRVTQKTRTNGIDFRGIARVWRENINDDNGDDNPSSIRVYAEISWPAEVEYAKRKKTRYSILMAHTTQVYATVPETETEPEIQGVINLNPNNNSNFEFTMTTPSGIISRDTVHAAGSDYTYTGTATYIRFKPKGNGNQNSLIVDGSAYALENKNIYEITSDSMDVYLYNENHGSGGAMGRWYVQISLSHGTVALESEDDIEEEETDNGLFSVSGGEVILSADANATFVALGASLKQGNSDCYITTSFVIDGSDNQPFGSVSDPVSANINDGSLHTYSAGAMTSGTEVSVTAWSYKPNKQLLMEQASTPGNQNVLVLCNGDTVSFDISSLESYLSSYLSNGTVSIADNQVLFLFELGTTNINQADFQDLAILLTVE